MFPRLLKGIATAGVVGLLSILLLEVLVRIALPQPAPARWLVPDARYGHRMRPDFHQRFAFGGAFTMDVQTNALGLRDDPIAPAQDGVPTVVFMGDSFTFGHGIEVENRFDRLTRRQLHEAGCPVRTINAGINAFGTLQATRFVADHLDVFDPDIVVYLFCENDPHDDTYFLERGISFDQVRFPGKTFLKNHSHLFRLAQHLYLLLLKSRYLDEKRAEQAAEAPGPPAPLTTAPEPAAPSSGITAEQWARTRVYLDTFLEQLHAHNPDARLVLMAVRPNWPDIREGMQQLVAASPLLYLDLGDAIAAIPPEAQHLGYDGHWSRRVHAAAADELTALLLDTLACGARAD